VKKPKKPKTNIQTDTSSHGDNLTTRSKVSRVSIASSSKRKSSKSSVVSASSRSVMSDDEQSIDFENDSASESSERSRDSSSGIYSTSTTSKKKGQTKAFDQNGRRASTQHAKNNISKPTKTGKKRSR
jgi:hypothetical protein